jgi:hypothetical protein
MQLETKMPPKIIAHTMKTSTICHIFGSTIKIGDCSWTVVQWLAGVLYYLYELFTLILRTIYVIYAMYLP